MVPLADMDAMEDAIRREADPRGMFSRHTIDTAGLVKFIRKRYKDSQEEHRREKDDMRVKREELKQKSEDEKEDLYRIIRDLKEEMQSRDEQGKQTRDDYRELQIKYKDMHEDNKAKDNRITDLAKEVKATFDTCQKVTTGSVKALKTAHGQMEHRIICIQTKHRQELNEMRGWNNGLQDRLKIARRLQPVITFHRAQVGTVCEMHEKLVQLKKSKTEELATKEKEKDKLRTQRDLKQREIDDLKEAAGADGKFLRETAALLSETRKDLSEAKGKIGSHERDVKTLNKWGRRWEDRYRAEEEECIALKSQMNVLKADQRMELIRAKAETEGLRTRTQDLEENNEKMDKELESWENGHRGNLRVSKPKHNNTQSENAAASLAKALKAANARADTLQISVNALQAQRGVWEKQAGDAANAYNPQAQEQVEHLESENRDLREAAERSATLETQLRANFEGAEQTLGERFANRTRELEVGFNQGFEDLRELRNQWFLHKRGLEEQHNREIVADCQRRDHELAAAWNEKKEELRRNEDDLQSREKDLATEMSRLHSSGQNIKKMEARATKAEKEVLELQGAAVNDRSHQMSHLHSSGQNIKKMEARATKAEKEVLELQVAAINGRSHRDLMATNLENEIQNQRRDGQRHLDLLNEETSKMAEWSRLPDLHSELQTANCSMNFFKYNLIYGNKTNETLSQDLYGADFNELDVRLLQDEGRPVLLAQLQAAKWTLERLKGLLAESPDVKVDHLLSILMAPRGDEDAAQPVEDIFGPSNDSQQFTPHTNSRKRSGAPLGCPTYGDHEDNVAPDDWGIQGQEVSTGARLSTREEISNRKRLLPKARRNAGPANSVPLGIIDPAIRDQ